MEKLMYRITMTENANSACNDLAIAAAKSNGSKQIFTLEQLQTIYLNEQLKYPTICADSTAELIGDNLLHIDRKVGDDYETVLIIEQVEIMELATLENVVAQRNGYGALAE